MLESSLPRWLERLRGNSKLQEAFERWKTGIRFIERSDVEVNGDGAERLLAAGNRATVDELVTEQRSKYVRGRRPILTELLKKTPLDFNEAVLLASATDKEFYSAQQLREEEATQRLHEGSEFLRQSNVAVNTETAKRLLASGDRAAVDLLVAERRSKYRKGRLEILTQLLNKEPLDFNEAVLLASATSQQFYTVQHLLLEELIGWMDQQGVSYNKKLAMPLILANDRIDVIDQAEKRRHQLVHGRTPAAELLLKKEKLEHRDAVLMLAAQDGEFATPEEKLVEDSLAWLDKQGVQYSRKDATELIMAKNWEVLTPRWEEQRQRAWLAKSPVLEQALTATQPDYRQAVLGATAEDSAFWPDYYSKGEAYAKGVGVSQNPDEAQRWFSLAAANFRAAAEHGDALSQFNLGVLFKDGKGVPQDHLEAIRWYQLAAAQNFPSAQFNLGVFYERGRGVPQDQVEALRWYNLAAAQGHPAAQYSMGRCYQLGAGVEQAPRQAVGWYRLAAEQGYASAEFQLAESYAKGIGVPEHRGEAVCWYRRAAQHGHAAAQTALKEMLGYVSNEPPVTSDAASEEQLGHHLTPSGTCCSVCGCTREAIRHFGWRCRQMESQ